MNPRKYCKEDNSPPPPSASKKKKNTAIIKPPSVHGERKYKRKTKVEREREDREAQRDDFLSFIKKKDEKDDGEDDNKLSS